MFIFYIVWFIICILIYILTSAILVSYQKYKKVQKRLAIKDRIYILQYTNKVITKEKQKANRKLAKQGKP